MKRRLLIIAIFLLAGALVNVAVAWAIALRVNRLGPPLDVTYISGPDGWWWAKRYARFGTTRITSQRERGKSDLRSSPTPPAEIMPNWPGLDIPTADYRAGKLSHESRLFEGRGWPARSLWCERYRENASMDSSARRPVPLEGSILIFETAFAKTIGKGAYRLPLRIIWPGFAFNVLFYATLLWLLICGPFVLRRFLRVRRGLCPKCAYPMGESSVCTECGKALPSVPLP